MSAPLTTKGLRGFTLIELLVVISIIGLLASIGISSFRGAIDKANIAQTQSTIHDFSLAIKQYHLNTGTCACPMHCYDGSCDALTIDSSCLKTKFGELISSFPPEDSWGQKWRYHCHPGGAHTGEGTCIFSSGPDKTIQQWPWTPLTFAGDDIGWCHGQPGNLGY